MNKLIVKIGLLPSLFLGINGLYGQNTDSTKAAKIEEVVVTAYGVKKEKKSLGYSFQDVKGQTLVDAKETNVTNALAGKVAGLQVIKGGFGPGSSSKINLRGFNSFKGDNQPLIVVDGVPLSNSLGAKPKNNNEAANNDFWNPDLDMGNGLSDLNSEDIESMSVLKGGAASALYGSRGGNGVILITTKSGKKKGGLGISYSTSLGFESLFMKPDMQNNFSQGSNGVVNPENSDNTTSWGPAFTESMKRYDNLKNFFKTGVNSQHNLSFQSNLGEGSSLYTSAGYLHDNSQIPNSTYERFNFMAKMNSTFGANKRWTSEVKAQYISTKGNNRPSGGQGDGNFYPAILLMPQNINIIDYREGQMQNNVTSRWITPNGINPYWSAYNSLNADKKDRILLNGYLKYQFNDWLSSDIRLGTDFYALNTDARVWTGSSRRNSYSTGNEKFYENNYIASITAKKDNLFGKWGGSLSVYGQMMETRTKALYFTTQNLIIPNAFNVKNTSDNAAVANFEIDLWKKINSVFAAAEINYDGYWFLNATTRTDWSSTLNIENRSYIYNSISTSLVLTDMLNKMNGFHSKFLTFAKLRAAYAVTGNGLEPYELYNNYVLSTDPTGHITLSRQKILYNANLKAEKLKTFEVGADLKFFNRVSLDVSYFNNNATGQLIDLPMNPLSGYEKMKISSGGLHNRGFEFVLNTDILKKENFTWNVNANLSLLRSNVDEINGDVSKYPIGGFDNITFYTEVGKPYGAIYGTKILRVEDPNSPYFGKLIVGANGLPQATPDMQYLGDQTPRSLFGFTSSFAYKNIGLSFLVDGRIGGKFFSATQLALQKAGLASDTAPGGRRDNFVLDAVVQQNGGYSSNTKEITQQDYWAAVTTGNLGITEQNVYDATNIRLRNIQLSYTFPKSIFQKMALQSAKVSFTANNVWMIYSKAKGVDPESVFAISSNAVGFENMAFPTTRSYLFTITLGF
ncbi:SusC/RagA family protein [Chryseobacterium indologenes]|uniref:SusC/RagA family TonB-linked outer membrane protein n=1 Tax=Chryseobacterium indologenes TaxID=253 RepID=UPI000BFC50BB|nr:SusC/RagA family TonB-linked outer membrane protein [Chryseobacterium indologenes]ATN06877.1 SusC/RagA family protein [Chryseobacterium indologenes]AYY84377.1 SusC/RagA family TonB-linked outer membrane protein [Chryseobacterium indologenes]QIX81331.1 SusC/RagA family TonB-linked outer membrane protein [Chryseobacterium indologenes]UDQ55078.1 SusC/RagA family TonB-linked outer membrane protein [Chryseobacterium indologenes]